MRLRTPSPTLQTPSPNFGLRVQTFRHPVQTSDPESKPSDRPVRTLDSESKPSDTPVQTLDSESKPSDRPVRTLDSESKPSDTPVQTFGHPSPNFGLRVQTVRLPSPNFDGPWCVTSTAFTSRPPSTFPARLDRRPPGPPLRQPALHRPRLSPFPGEPPLQSPAQPMRSFLTRLGQVAVTFVLFAICNKFAFNFEIEKGVSILFPATAIDVLACMTFGPWAAVGIILGTIATPWSTNPDLPTLTAAGVVSAIEGLIPWAVFRLRRDLHRDLRDMKSLLAFLLFGCVLNTLFSAVVGNIVVVHHPTAPIDWNEIFVWFIADFTAAVLLAMPVLAFGGWLFNPRDREPRKLVNALQILSVVVLLGWSAAFAIR